MTTPSLPPMAGERLEVSLYLLTFSNGKSYVGVTKRPNVRFRAHKKNAEMGKPFALSQAWRKHGEPVMTIIGKVTNYETAFAMEIALIERLNTKAPGGYNMTNGGDSLVGVIRGEAWRAKISESNRRRAQLPEVRAAASKATAARWSDPAYRERVNSAREAKQAELRNNPEWKAKAAAKRAEAMRLKWQDPTYQVKMAARKAPVMTPETRARAAASRLASMTPDQHSEAVRKSWATRKRFQSPA